MIFMLKATMLIICCGRSCWRVCGFCTKLRGILLTKTGVGIFFRLVFVLIGVNLKRMRSFGVFLFKSVFL